ncbi:MAG: hypothetical protein AAGL89_01520 [Pseudomonadota bacterium]
MRVLAALLFGFGLVACTEASVAPPQVSLLRNPTAPFGSQVDVTASDLNGDWIVRQGLANGWPATVGVVSFVAEDMLLLIEVEGRFCEEGGPCVTTLDRTDYVTSLPGRFVSREAEVAVAKGLPPEFWVLWMDFDRRTVAIGDPAGRFVAILDRAATGGEDRITAAREILDWYGYDLDQVTAN